MLLLYSLFTHDCVARHDSNTIIKLADDTTGIGRRSETWPVGARQDSNNSLSFNVTKTNQD